ncbi:MAG TPA: PhzF family phenazine biosynthesis protein [Dehalococcoidia bacterium]
MGPQPITVVDAFTDTAFTGNPAAVCLLPAARDEAWMRNIAREMNLSETAFLVRRRGGDFDLRWFTPKVEVDLCGHATLAGAHVLWEEGALDPDQTARFHTRSGPLTAVKRGNWIEMDFPATRPAPGEAPPGLLDALGAREARCISRSRFDYLVELASEDAVRALAPDFSSLERVHTRGAIVTAPASTAGFDFVSRFFAPAAGIDEDPVTGSAHCALAPFWAARLGRDSLTALQVSERGGVVKVTLAGERVRLSGQAITVWSGELRG